ncbi:MAG: hypothetical protein H0T69_07110 [Thermoleophilaceae bacterium]|nr:hypothetical protein [Thermoleophilaceae bacterium]
MAVQPELELLVELSEAYFTTDGTMGKRARIERFKHSGGATIRHHAWEHGKPIDDEELEFLQSAGFVDVDYIGEYADAIRVTPEGQKMVQGVKRLQDDSEPEEGAAVSLEWEAVARPVLEAAYQAWAARGAPSEGIPTPAIARHLGRADDDPETFRAVALLEQRGYLDAPSPLGTETGPVLVTVTALGLEVVGGWPATTAEAASAALLAALDREIAETDEPVKRGKLEQLRDAATEVGTSALAQVLGHILKGQL